MAATFCATLADEWVRAGITDVVVAPGSRSTPLTLAVSRKPGLRVHVVLDERSAAFTALGISRATGHPAVVVTTSGTAAVELHPAVMEAHHDAVPLLCVTADRPPELQDVGAPQTIGQVGLFGSAVRWQAAPGPPDPAMAGSWRSLAARAVIEALGHASRPGPVHLNLAFREPLVGEPGPLPPGRAGGSPWHGRLNGPPRLADEDLGRLSRTLAGAAGVIVAGPGAGDPAAVHALAETLGWPVLADPRSGARQSRPTTVAYFDQILRAKGFAAEHAPEIVLRLGRLPASKVLAQWFADTAPTEIVVDASGAWIDPARSAASFVVADPTDTCTRLAAAAGSCRSTPSGWLAGWQEAEAAASAAIVAVLEASGGAAATEPGVARETLAAVPDGGVLVVSSSMPVRDVEWFGAPRSGVRVVSNRGANGIDGVTSTAAGVAIGSGRPTVLLTGDLAFLHDSNALLGLAGRGLDLTIVVIDNHGGGIFSFLPTAQALGAAEFERLFATPQAIDPEELLRLHRVPLYGSVAEAVGHQGTSAVVVRTDRRANVAVHERLNGAVTEAIDG